MTRIAAFLSVLSRASASGNLSHAAVSGCGDVSQLDECVGADGCLWLVIEGRCSGHDDPYAQANPGCCVGGEGSPCERRAPGDFRDGDCRIELPANGIVTEAPPLEQMVRFTYLAAAAYCDHNLATWSCGPACDSTPGIQDVSVIEGDKYKLLAIVAFSEAENGIVVSVRGSEVNIENWIQNLDFFKTKPFAEYPDAAVHEGFYNAWQSIREPVLAAVQSLKDAHGVNTVYTTGHSLGGAIAHHAAFELGMSHGYETVVFSYGAPRTGDFVWAQAVTEHVSKLHRITHAHDIVPHTPFQIMGFYHVTTEIFFSDALNWRLCDGTGEDESCSNNCPILGCVSVFDHLKYLDIAIGKDVGDGYQCSGSSSEAVVV